MRAAAEALAAAWAAAPPAHPVIVAGSTGSRGATRAFMAAVARLPQGALVLPGLRPTCPPRSGTGSATTSPAPPTIRSTGFRRLADALGFDPARGARPGTRRAPPAPARNALVSLALRPGAGHRPVAQRGRARSPAALGAGTARG